MIKRIRDRILQCGIMTRIVIAFAILVVVPFFIVAGVMGMVFQNYAVNTIGESSMDAMSSVGAQITSSIKKYEEDSMVLYHNNYIRFLTEKKATPYNKTQIELTLKSICFSDTSIHAIYVVTPYEVFHSESYSRLLDVMQPYEEEIVQAGGACLWYPTNRLLGEEQENKYILARSLNDGWEKNVGILYMVVDDRVVTNAFEQLNSKYAMRYLVDENGKILYSSKTSEFGKELDISELDSKKITSYQQIGIGLNSGIMIARNLMRTKWHCISIIPMKTVLLDILHLERPFFILAIVYVIFLFVMLRIMKKYIFNPLKVLKSSMDQYAQGNLGTAHMESVGVGEFASLSKHFNDMTVRIADLMEDYKEEVDEKNRQRMLALTSQLKPHFVYNALNTIKWMAVLNHQDNIQHLTESLVHIFMNAAKVDDENYCVRDELELVKNYAVIQKARFMNFELLIDVQPESLDCSIRKFLLQPIIENAIVHGLGRGKIKNTEIKIRVWLDGFLYITVRDEGIGFDVEKWRRSKDVKEDHTNIGLHNVEQIIHLEYGDPYRLEIDSYAGHGTTIKYILPIQRKGNTDDTGNHCR